MEDLQPRQAWSPPPGRKKTAREGEGTVDDYTPSFFPDIISKMIIQDNFQKPAASHSRLSSNPPNTLNSYFEVDCKCVQNCPQQCYDGGQQWRCFAYYFGQERGKGLRQILLLILIMLRKGVRQSSFVEKTQPKAGREDQSYPYRPKNNTNPSTHEQQHSKELIRKPEDSQGHIPNYRVTKTRFDKNPPRYFDYSPLKSREKSQFSPYKQEFEAYNFAHLHPAQSFDRRKKGRSYFYKRNDDKREGTANDVSNVSNISTQNAATKPLGVVLQSQPTDESKEGIAELTLEEIHYEMVKTLQKCKQAKHF